MFNEIDKNFSSESLRLLNLQPLSKEFIKNTYNLDEYYYYCYRTTNKINNKFYIGIHYGQLFDSYLGSGNYICDAINNYGIENFYKEIIKVCDTPEELLEIEAELVTETVILELKSKYIYNLKPGGRGFTSGFAARVRKDTGEVIFLHRNDPLYKDHKDEWRGVSSGCHFYRHKITGNYIFCKDTDVRLKTGDYEFYSPATGTAPYYHEDDIGGKVYRLDTKSEEVLSGKYISISTFIFKNKSIFKDDNGNTYLLDKDDPRVLSGEFVGINKGLILCKKVSNINETLMLSKDDPRLLSGEYVAESKNRFFINKDGENKMISEGTNISDYLKDGWKIGRDYGQCPECGNMIAYMGQVEGHFENCIYKHRYIISCKELNIIRWVSESEVDKFINSGKWSFNYFQRRINPNNNRFIYVCPHCFREFSGSGPGFRYHFKSCKLRDTSEDKWKDLPYYSELEGKYRTIPDNLAIYLFENKYKHN